MALSFPLNNAPFGLLALANALKAPASTLALSPVPVETSAATTLVTKDTAKAIKITGVVPIARYLVRALDNSKTFYPESSDVANYTAQDQLLDIVRQTIATPKHLTTLATAAENALAATGSFLLSKEQPQLCDYAVWGSITAYTKSHSLLSNLKDLEKFMAWMARMDERAECKEAISTMDKALEQAKETLAKEAAAAAAERALSSAVIEVPTIEGSDPVVDPLDEFKNVMAFQLSKLVDVDIKILYDALEAPRAAENGHIALSVPRLRLKGKDPIAVAAEIVDKVWTRTGNWKLDRTPLSISICGVFIQVVSKIDFCFLIVPR